MSLILVYSLLTRWLPCLSRYERVAKLRFPTPPLQDGTKDAFVDVWSRHYADPNEHLYIENIERELTVPVIQALFEWKNGSRMSVLKHKRVVEYYRPGDQVHLSLNNDEAIYDYVGRDNAAIWNVFWLHCLAPTKFPIYDQHAHRAMMFMNGAADDLEIPSSPKKKAQCYVDDFMPFFAEIVGPRPTIQSSRQVDRSLFAFGKFIKSVRTELW